ASSTAGSASAASSTAAASVGAAPAGSSIKRGAASSLPAAVGAWAKYPGSTGSVIQYRNDGNFIGVSFLSGSEYSTIVTAVTAQRTRAGTGLCGSTSDPTNLTCYLKAADGVYNVSADAGDVPLPQLVAFVNQWTAALGTS